MLTGTESHFSNERKSYTIDFMQKVIKERRHMVYDECTEHGMQEKTYREDKEKHSVCAAVHA